MTVLTKEEYDRMIAENQYTVIKEGSSTRLVEDMDYESAVIVASDFNAEEPGHVVVLISELEV